MSKGSNLINQYLLATPAIQDPLFASSVVYMCEHSEHGSMGVVINHIADQTLEDVFQQLDISCDHAHILQQPIFIGGPVKLQQGFVLHDSPDEWDNSLQVSSDCFLTSSRDILEAIASNEGPEHHLILLGYSGWAAGQLEQELQDNSWLTATSSPDITFCNDIDHKWQKAFDSLGFNLDKLSPPPEMPETVIGFDFGSHWIGMAVGQTTTGTASPLPPVAVRQHRPDWLQIGKIIDQWKPDKLIVGYPTHMDGQATNMTAPVTRFSRQLEGRFRVATELIDERLTTREAWQIVEDHAQSRLSKPDMDSIAAVLITETWLHQRQSTTT